MSRIQVRRGTTTEWADANPVLYEGEFGLETNTNKLKMGDGQTAWNSLGYLSLNWETLAGKPDYVAAGATKADARAAIDAAALDGNGYIPLEQWGPQVVDGGTATVTTATVIDGGTA